MKAKWDNDKATTVSSWLSALSGVQVSGSDPDSMQKALKSGVVLCKVINAIWPGTIKSINASSMPFPQRENISAYLEACKSKGVKEVSSVNYQFVFAHATTPQTDVFMTVDLFDGANMLSVLDNLIALGNLASSTRGYTGPKLVVKDGAVTLEGRVAAAASPAASSVSVPSSPPSFAPPKPFDPVVKPVSQVSVSAPAAAPPSRPPAAAPSSSNGFCGNCGKARAPGAKFCSQCGERL